MRVRSVELGTNARALEAVLVVHGEGESQALHGGDDGWLQMWLLKPYMMVEGGDPAAASSCDGTAHRMIQLDRQSTEGAHRLLQ